MTDEKFPDKEVEVKFAHSVTCFKPLSNLTMPCGNLDTLWVMMKATTRVTMKVTVSGTIKATKQVGKLAH